MGIQKKRGFKIRQVKTNLDKFKTTVPAKLGNIARNHFLEGFRKGGGKTDASIGGWAKRKTPRTARGRARNTGRALLVKTGKTRADLKRRETSFRRIVVGIRSVPYARYHNTGTNRMPQREIVGRSRVLEKRLKNKIVKEIGNIFK